MTAAPIFSSSIALPLACERLLSPPSSEARRSAAWANDGVLGFLLHEIDAEASQRPTDEHLAETLAPLRNKLDLVIEMVARLSYRNVQLPPVQPIELGLSRVGWVSPEPIAPGEPLRLSLYFHHTYLEPLVLYGTAASCVAADTAYQVQAELDELPEQTGEAFARLAFLAQRRHLASRAGAGAGAAGARR